MSSTIFDAQVAVTVGTEFFLNFCFLILVPYQIRSDAEGLDLLLLFLFLFYFLTLLLRTFKPFMSYWILFNITLLSSFLHMNSALLV